MTEVAEVYTSETAAPTKAARNIKTTPSNATGRRKEAVARVRLVPGTGRWVVNGRDLADYFPNKVHQQLVNDPFKISISKAVSMCSQPSTVAASRARLAHFALASHVH